jgi:hypothetical protein
MTNVPHHLWSAADNGMDCIAGQARRLRCRFDRDQRRWLRSPLVSNCKQMILVHEGLEYRRSEVDLPTKIRNKDGRKEDNLPAEKK